MGRKKVDRSNKVMQTFETTRPLKIRLEELAKKTNRCNSAIYRLARKLGRLPTEEEVLNRQVGRPRKYN